MFSFPRTEERFTPKLSEPVYADVVGEGFYDRCKVRDISANGISVFVRHDFQGVNLTNEVDLHITLPGRKSFKVIGQICHRGLGKDHYFGIRIISIDSNSRSLLDEYLRSLK